jgi:hypothetical protein
MDAFGTPLFLGEATFKKHNRKETTSFFSLSNQFSKSTENRACKTIILFSVLDFYFTFFFFFGINPLIHRGKGTQ